MFSFFNNKKKATISYTKSLKFDDLWDCISQKLSTKSLTDLNIKLKFVSNSFAKTDKISAYLGETSNKVILRKEKEFIFYTITFNSINTVKELELYLHKTYNFALKNGIQLLAIEVL